MNEFKKMVEQNLVLGTVTTSLHIKRHEELIAPLKNRSASKIKSDETADEVGSNIHPVFNRRGDHSFSSELKITNRSTNSKLDFTQVI